jgi:hypothetical protein
VKNLIAFEWMFFGIGHLAAAAERRGARLHLLAPAPEIFAWDLERCGLPGPVPHTVDIDDPEAVERVLAEIGQVDGIVHPTEEGVSVALRVAAERGLPGQDAGAVRMVRDKMKLRQHLHASGLSAGSSIPLEEGTTWEELENQVGVPFIVKDRSGSGSRHVWRVDTPEQLRAIRDEQLEVKLLAEPFFVGPLYSAETLTWQGETRLLGFSGRVLSPEPHFREEVFTFPVRFSAERTKHLEEWICGVLGSISYTDGFAHTEFVVTQDGFEVIEINPRIPGGPCGENFSDVLGADVYGAFVDMALGERPQLLDEPLEPQEGSAIAFLYPPHPGVFDRIDGAGDLDRHDGSLALYQNRQSGSQMDSVHDLWGAVGCLSARGETSEVATLNALSAMRGLRVRMRDEQD